MHTYRFHLTDGKVLEAQGKDETDAWSKLLPDGHKYVLDWVIDYVECWYKHTPDPNIVSQR